MTKQDLFRFVCQIVQSKEGCWVWQGGKDRKGYGKFWWNNQTGRAHRFAYFYWRGPIPTHLEPDHLCRNTSCVNPFHLEVVTRRENLIRGNSPVGFNARKLSCIRGHVFTEENTYKYKNARYCRTCNAERAIERHRAKTHT